MSLSAPAPTAAPRPVRCPGTTKDGRPCPAVAFWHPGNEAPPQLRVVGDEAAPRPGHLTHRCRRCLKTIEIPRTPAGGGR